MERKEIQLLVISLGIVFFTLLITLLVLFFYFLKKKNNYLVEKMESEMYFQSELVKTRIEIKDQTLSEISKELHDNIGQIVSVGIMQLNMYIQTGKSIKSKELTDLKHVLAKSLDEIRILSRIINKDNLLQSNFIEAIKQDLERIKKLKHIHYNYKFTGEIPEINEEHDLFIYRIFQEALHNSLKHSLSDLYEVDITTTADLFQLKMKDFGIGYDTKKVTSGIGLNNMKLRAKLIGAKLIMESNTSGTSITLEYPLTTPDENKS
ncbi:sensor histidine kinase [Flavobacterium sp. FlaQc-52]|jgi:signal transduction histidine kinase|uniref:histidine kinase n=2 Tax=Flavobacterium TaxID=237 RepID=A0ABU4R9K9_9FLAO|nr:ATP-binding protein [Flavobacterium sp. F-323]KLT70489.1 histidine kinase [Flavobacterium sp. ABG]MDX6189260.1 ATP-binding protein [Flavobacterium sp. Fl-318]UFH41356.1 ATP-binding protein [Flavobacterium sp. F-323]